MVLISHLNGCLQWNKGVCLTCALLEVVEFRLLVLTCLEGRDHCAMNGRDKVSARSLIVSWVWLGRVWFKGK